VVAAADALFLPIIRQKALYVARLIVGEEFAEDVVQAATLAMLERPSAGGGRAWFFTIVRHKAQDLRRRERLRARPFSSLESALTIEEAVFAHDRTDEIDARDTVEPLLRWLSQANPREALAVQLIDRSGWTPKEAAALLGWSRGMAKTMASRGRQRLRALANVGLREFETPTTTRRTA
jgi:RNA polymerase sigma factor (sigma-70 family)